MDVKYRVAKTGEVVNFGENEIKNIAIIAPSDKMCVRYFFHLSKLSLLDVQSYEINIIASLIVTYTDVFKKNARSQSRF